MPLDAIHRTGAITLPDPIDIQRELDALFDRTRTLSVKNEVFNLTTTNPDGVRKGVRGERIIFSSGINRTQFINRNGLTSWGQIGSTVASNHGTLSGLPDDDHLNNAFLPGRLGGQRFIGGTASGEDLEFESTSDPSKGNIVAKDNFLIKDGSAAKPSLAFIDDPDTGLFRHTILALRGVQIVADKRELALFSTTPGSPQNNLIAFGGALSVATNVAGVIIGTTCLINQDLATAAIPTLELRQDDISEGLINFVGSDRGTGSTAGGNKAATFRVELNGTVFRILLFDDA